MKKTVFPFNILALAPFCPVTEDPVTPAMVTTDLTTLDDAVAKLTKTLSITVSKDLCPQGVLNLEFNRMKDFKPQALVTNTPYLKNLAEAAKFIDEAVASGLPTAHIAKQLQTKWPDLPLDLTIPAGESPAQPASNNMIDNILAMVDTSGISPSGTRIKADGPKNWQVRINTILKKILEIIFADEEFRQLEAIWQGVATLVRQGPIKESESVRLHLAPISMDLLPEVLDGLLEQLIIDTPNLILIDLSFDNSPRSIQLLEKIADFANTLLAPTAVWITPRFFNLKGWNELKKLAYLKHYLEDSVYAKWRRLKNLPGSNWLAVTCNRFIVRQPYGSENRPRTVFFTEHKPLWISPVWALGTLAAKSIEKYGWPTRLTDYRNILLDDLAVGKFGGDETISTEVALSEDRIMQFVEAGIAPLTGVIRKDIAFMPKETTLSGDSFKFQLFFNRIVGYLINLRDELSDTISTDDLCMTLQIRLADFFRDTGHDPPPDLSVIAEQAKEGKQVSLRIVFTPPRSILATSQRIDFSFNY